MVLRSPCLFVTIPIALVIGLIWFRRKKINCDSGGNNNSTKKQDSSIDNYKKQSSEKDLKHSISLPIGSTPKKLDQSNNNSFEKKLGKSAPIDITPHKTSPSRGKSDINNFVGSQSSDKTLHSIEENSLESVDLPGSIDCRRRFSLTIKTSEPPVVIKATTMDVDKSPQSSFETLTTSPTIANNAMANDKVVHVSKLKTNDKTKLSAKCANENIDDKENYVKSPRALPVASPPLSLYSNKSHDSGDSGKGSSPPNSEGGQHLSSIQSYDFELPQTLVGYLVGKGGSNICKIRNDCSVNISIVRHPIKTKKYKLCTIQGTKEQIDKALAKIKSRMPPKTNLDRVDIELETVEMLAAMTFDANLFQLNLIDGINNDVVISQVINAGHLFLQQPFHPTYLSLSILQNCLNQSYSSFESPMLPNYNASTVCVGQIDGHWYRLQIIEHQIERNTCIAKYLDYGGYSEILTTELRQIRKDFMALPFQAIECTLSDIKPKGGEWCEEAAQVIVELTQFRTLQAQVASYSEAGIPEIRLFSFLDPNNIVYINQELVARNYAEWCESVGNA